MIFLENIESTELEYEATLMEIQRVTKMENIQVGHGMYHDS